MLDAGLVRIEAARAGSLLRLRVENDVDPDSAGAGTNGARGTGLGLANVRQRLAAAYGHEASVRWARRDGRFVVELALPVLTAAAPQSITESEGA
jgi:LytS/YehU family sensor histidine kinase